MNPPASPDLDEALAAHRAGRLADAAAIYERMIAADASSASALHLLGVVRLQQGQPEAGAPLIERALVLRPNAAAYHSNLGNARREMKNLEGAIRSYRRALELDPQLADALSNLGAALRERGELGEASQVLERAATLQPRSPAVLNNLGAALDGLGRKGEAIALFRRALAVDPRFVDAALNLARALGPIGAIDEGVAWLTLAVALAPQNPLPHVQLALALKDLGRAQDAVDLLERFIAAQTPTGAIYTALGIALSELGRIEEVERAYRKALELEPADSNHVANLGAVRVKQGRFAEALEYFQRAAAMAPDSAGAYNGIGTAVGGLGRFEESEAAYRRALEIDPHHREAHLNLGLTLLTLGKFEEGWTEYEYRLFRTRTASGPRWNGEDLGTLSLLVFPEQGAGDNIQFIRYLAVLRQKYPDARLVFPAPDALRPLFKAFLDRHRIEAPKSHENVEIHGFQSALLSLPAVFRTRTETVPADIPYLEAPKVLLDAWRRRLGQPKGLRVGLCWAGNPQYSGDAARSVPAAALAPIFEIPGVEFVSVQKGASTALAHPRLLDHMEEAVDFAHTAALLSLMDVVISVDTSVAHLAGALGRPTFMLNRVATDWRWLTKGESSAWYPTMRILRQSKLGQWDDVVAQVSERLAALAASRK